MDTATAAPPHLDARWSVASLSVRATETLGCVDLTDEIERLLTEAGVSQGLCVVFCAHTTASVLVNEWEDGALDDLRHWIGSAFPSDRYYAHDDLGRRTQNLQRHERRNGHAHLAQMTLGGTSQALPVANGRLCLGRWQRVFLIELDEPRERTIVVQFAGS